MKKILLIFLTGVSNLAFAQNEKVSGKLIDDNLDCLSGVKITNLNTGIESTSDLNGRYEIMGTRNATLEFRLAGVTTEKIPVEKSAQILNLILINKTVNCLGAIWTDRQYRKAYRQIGKRLNKLYKKAGEQNVWQNNHCGLPTRM